MTWAIIGGVLAALLVGGYFLARRTGRLGAERDAAKKEAEHASEANEIDERVHSLSDADRDRWLRRRD